MLRGLWITNHTRGGLVPSSDDHNTTITTQPGGPNEAATTDINAEGFTLASADQVDITPEIDEIAEEVLQIVPLVEIVGYGTAQS